MMAEHKSNPKVLAPSRESREIGARLGLSDEDVLLFDGYLDLLEIPEDASVAAESFDMSPLCEVYKPIPPSVCRHTGRPFSTCN